MVNYFIVIKGLMLPSFRIEAFSCLTVVAKGESQWLLGPESSLGILRNHTNFSVISV
jgi:hypothetical protein